MYVKRLMCVMALLFGLAGSASAQQNTIRGRVMDASGNVPLEGVTVMVAGSTTGTVTGPNGEYAISASASDVLAFRFIGMEDHNETVGARTTIDVILSTKTRSMDEIVVVGYGMVKRSDLTGSVSSLKSEELLKNNPVSFEQGMQGRIAGVHVTQNDGAPGGGISVQIRGTNSFLGGTEPLYVIDGVPLSSSNNDQTITFDTDKDVQSRNVLSALSPNDIESIEVLKDGSSIAIYGARGANGVVLITTKKGKAGRDKLQFNYNMSVNSVSNKLNMLGGQDYARYQNESYINTQTINSGSYNPAQLPYSGMNNDLGEYVKGPDDFDNDPYYWQDQIFRTAVTHEYNLNYSGGSKGFHYSVGATHLDQQGIIDNSGYKRSTLKFSLGRQIKEWIELGTSTNLSVAKANLLKASTKNMNNGDEGVVRSALFFPSTYLSGTEVTIGEFSTVANPLRYTENLNESRNYSIYTSNYANIYLAKGLVFRSVVGFNLSINTANRYFPSTMQEGLSVRGLSQAGDNTWQSFLWENMLMYNRSCGKHNINATLASSWEESSAYNKRITVEGFGSDATEGWILGDASKANIPTSSKWDAAQLSYILRAAYGYDNRYLLTVTMRRDASSKFAENLKAQFFPSMGLGWRVSEEQFLQGSNLLTNLKLRYSWGTSGNSAIGAYGSLAQLVGANFPFGSSTVNGYAPDPYNPGNPDLKWETTYQHDLGIDLSLLDKVEITFDFYNKDTKNLLQYKSMPSSTGIVHVLSNLGDVRNRGFEISVNANIIRNKDFSWNAGFNFAKNKNTILRVGDEGDLIFPNKFWNSLTPFVLTAGRPIGQMYGYVEEGLWNTREEVINSKQFQSAYPGYTVSDNTAATETIIQQKWIGEVRIKDFDDSGTITDADMTYIGDVNPDFTYGFNMNFTYKNFDFSFLFSGVRGNDILNMNALRWNNPGGARNIPKSIYDRIWTVENGGSVPKNYYDSGRNLLFTDRFIEDGSYLKLRNLTLGYTLKSPFKGIESLRVSVSANNLLTITDYTGYDPEVNAFGSDPVMRGVDAGGYPYARTFNFGVNLTF